MLQKDFETALKLLIPRDPTRDVQVGPEHGPESGVAPRSHDVALVLKHYIRLAAIDAASAHRQSTLTCRIGSVQRKSHHR